MLLYLALKSISTMKILIIKTSSMGDIIHTLPALTDAHKAFPQAQFDWIVEEAFVDLADAHPAVNRVIPIALRRWRKNPLRYLFSKEVKHSLKAIRQAQYDIVIDAQGLLKSAIITGIAKGKAKHGLDKRCSRGKIDGFYTHKHDIDYQQPAIDRVRQLFAQALGYAVPKGILDYGLDSGLRRNDNQLVFIHATAWTSKQWPEPYWRELANKLKSSDLQIYLPAGTDAERTRAERIANELDHVHVLPKCALKVLMVILQQAKAVVAVDTGLAHLAAAVNTPCITLYGASDVALTGTQGNHQIQLKADFHCSPCVRKTCQYIQEPFPPCYQTLRPETVYETLLKHFE